MDILWNPWRYAYINQDQNSSKDTISDDCVFCRLIHAPEPDAEKFIIHRAARNFIILNKYPYITAHLLIVPFVHLADLDSSAKEVSDELMDLTKKCQTVLREVYQPDGINLGMNQGKAAGAGVAGHFHLHILPRWIGDANFMTPIAETRMIPESLETTYDKLKDKF